MRQRWTKRIGPQDKNFKLRTPVITPLESALNSPRWSRSGSMVGESLGLRHGHGKKGTKNRKLSSSRHHRLSVGQLGSRLNEIAEAREKRLNHKKAKVAASHRGMPAIPEKMGARRASFIEVDTPDGIRVERVDRTKNA